MALWERNKKVYDVEIEKTKELQEEFDKLKKRSQFLEDEEFKLRSYLDVSCLLCI